MIQAIFSILKYVTGFLSAAETIVGILKGFSPEVTAFIEKLIETKDKIIDTISDITAKEQAKEAAHKDVVALTMDEFSSSPSWVERWMVEVYIWAFIRARKKDEGKTETAKEKGIIANPQTVQEYTDNMRKLGIG